MPSPLKGRLATVLLTLFGLAVTAIVAVLIVIYTGAYNVAATDDHFPPVRWVFDTTFHNAVAARAEEVRVPDDLGRAARVREGAEHYTTLCAPCHGLPGGDRPTRSEYMLPQPPHLAEHAHWQPAELYWIIENGVKMSGMPAFGPWHEESHLWAVTAFVSRMPDMTQAEYERMVAEREAETREGETRPSAMQQAQARRVQAQAGAQQSGAGASDAAGSTMVKMTDQLTFEPPKITIIAGETVTWTNPSRLVHTVTADPAEAQQEASVHLPEGAEAFNSGIIEPGGTYTHTFTVPGRYVYFCIPHEMAGMIGEVIVEPEDET